MTYRILVADDEPKTRNGICKFLSACGLPLTVCAQAENGEEALRLLREHRPELVLLDICMPNMDGLEFLTEAKRLGIPSKFIVLTGYDEFTFAKRSVALHAYAYLLKPVDEEELTACLRQAIAELDEEQTEDRRNAQTATQVESNRALLRHAFFLSWMDGQLSAEAWRENAAFWELCYPENACLTLLVPDFGPSDAMDERERAVLLYGAGNIAEELLAPCAVRCCARHDRGYAMLITDREPGEALLRTVSDALREHLSLASRLISAHPDGPTDVSATIARLFAALEEQARANPLIDQIRRYLEENYRNPELNLTDLSRDLAVSKPHLTRLIRSAFSTTCIGYLTGIRMRHAVELMADPQNKVSWIALEVGYSNLHYFSHAFKKYTGLSPSVYREKLHEKSL